MNCSHLNPSIVARATFVLFGRFRNRVKSISVCRSQIPIAAALLMAACSGGDTTGPSQPPPPLYELLRRLR